MTAPILAVRRIRVFWAPKDEDVPHWKWAWKCRKCGAGELMCSDTHAQALDTALAHCHMATHAVP